MPTIEDYAKQPRGERLARVERAADELTAAIAGRPAAALARRPDETNWAAVEIVCHLRDIEEIWGGRFQMFLAMDDPKLLPIDADRMAADRQYLRCDTSGAIEAFRTRRRENLDTLRALTADQWRRGGIHAQRGRMTFDDFLSVMAWHDDNHLAQLQRALEGRP